MNNLVAGDIMMACIKELKTELAELKSSIPQIKHDAIMGAMQSTEVIQADVGAVCDTDDLHFYAQSILTQAKEQSE
jgi:hypothetical protein